MTSQSFIYLFIYAVYIIYTDINNIYYLFIYTITIYYLIFIYLYCIYL